MATHKPEVSADDKVNIAADAAPSSGDRVVVVYSTFPDVTSGEAAGRVLVDAGLVACANIIPGVVSIYRWQGAIQRDGEVIVLFKTRAALAARVIEEVKTRHSYATPAVLMFEPTGGSGDFMAWIVGETGGGLQDETAQAEGALNDKS